MPTPRPVVVSPEAFARVAARTIYDAMADAYSASVRRIRELGVRQLESFGICLGGGPFMDEVYERLVDETRQVHCYPWYAVHIWQTDERWVTREHADSRFGQIFRTIVRETELDVRNVRRIQVGDGPPDAVAAWYGAGIRSFDILVLPMGERGEVAGLSPGSSALRERRAKAVAVTGPDERPRITITPPVIEDAKQIIALARGAGSSLSLWAALNETTSFVQTPARLARGATWIVDEPAAMMLGEV